MIEVDTDKPQILLVDDKLENLHVLSTLLEDLDVELVLANSGYEALEKARQQAFALVLLDVQMPGMDGFETAELILQEPENELTTIIFVSAVFSGEHFQVRGIQSGAIDFIEKPIIPDILLGKVNRFLEIYRHRITMENVNSYLEKQVARRTAKLAEANRALRLRNLELERFTFAVSHDLKNPAVTIKTFLHILRESLDKSNMTQVAEAVDFIDNASDKMNAQVQALIDFLKTGRSKMESQPCSLETLLDEACSASASAIYEKQATIIRDNCEQTLYGDPTLLGSVWQNLIDNALKYSKAEEPPLIKVGVKGDTANPVFYVSDNGIGIDQEYWQKIFGLFDRLDPTRKDGIGIGLAMVRRIVEAYDGTIEVEDSVPGEGSCFAFSLPKALQQKNIRQETLDSSEDEQSPAASDIYS